MRITAQKILKAATFVVVIVLTGMIGAFAQQPITPVAVGQKTEVLGYIYIRDADAFKMTTPDGSKSYLVVLTPDTTVKSNSKGVFRGGTKYESSYLLRGLRVEVEGTGNSEGAIVAKAVRFNETDLRSAQSLEVRSQPLEQRVAETEENAKRQQGQIEENAALTTKAQATADDAMKSAVQANNRINGLDEWDSVKTITVPFATGSSSIGPKGKEIIDEAAAWVKSQNTKGWMVAVIGFADSTGKTTANKTLSEKRANQVIGYLVSKHSLPLQRLIQPFGAGVDQPVATNETAEGRSQNRRVEIRLLKNKGITNTQ
jgi:OmpA-OmpF porin, OOP family